jgi:hypothetical protein
MEESFLLLLDAKLYFLPFEGENLHSSARKLKEYFSSCLFVGQQNMLVI